MDGRQPVELSGKQSAVLATLLLNVNTMVSKERLITALWDSPPPSAAANLRTYISQLRRALPTETRLLTTGSGYSLQVDTEMVDLLIFDQEVRLARQEAERGEPEAAVGRFERALALWHGQPAEGTSLRGDLLDRVTELEEHHTQARLEYAEMKLGLGHSREVVDDLRCLLTEQPLREKAWYLLMLAFARTGQRDRALEAYRRARDVLVAELGVEPGRDLQQLQATILGGDLPAVEPPVPGGGGVCQLPLDIADFVGRRGELSAAIEAISPGRNQASRSDTAGNAGKLLAPTVPVCVISGQGGVGKSTLAVHVAHHVRQDFRDGQLYINLRGGDDHPIDPEKALGRLLRGLGVDMSAIPVGLDQRAELYRSKLANRRYLVVLDDAGDEGQLYPLLPGTPGCAVLITSRHRLTGLPATQVIDLPMMPSSEALELLRRIIGADRAAEEPGDAEVLVQLCGGLPLAVRITGAKLAARPHWSLDQLVIRLSNTRNRLRHLTHGSQAVRTSLAVGYQGLTSPEQRLFRLLGLIEAREFAVWVAAALLDIQHAEAEDMIERLVDVRLLDVAGRDQCGQTRFRFHDLTRVYARECAGLEEPENEGIAAVRRALSAWLGLTRQAHMRLCGGDYRLVRGRSPLWSSESEVIERHVLPDPLGWVEAEREGIVAAVRQSAELGAGELCWELAAAAMYLFETRSLHDEWRTTHKIALDSTQRSGDTRGQATMLNGLARLHMAQNDLPRCGQALKEALQLFDQVQDRHGHAMATVNMAELHRLRGSNAHALACYREAIDSLVQVDDRGTQITVMRGIGRIHMNSGKYDLADPYLRQAVKLAEDTGDVRSREFTRVLLGEIELARGNPAAAEGCFSQALAGLDAIGFPRGSAYASLGLASVRLAQQDFTDAERLLRHALDIYENVGEGIGQARVLFSWAELRRLQRRYDEAAATLVNVVAICQAIPVPRRHGLALRALGDVYRDAGDLPAAVDAWRSSLAVLHAISAPEVSEIAAVIERYANDGSPAASA
ncbi:AfsR/SARP family transcriptional regulator [Nonomuraea turcica]|uniref:AfsR/SARP family transcriptional regulator n=1 Tax=Nonomuraea sp. G32 TaxID=3067274 RepID=UPI00273ADF97|nr:BTAD domain-containing putative transcriptional regulator [Nonomuraea sp. G32]MDP4504178.1 BTAD domain-containing putative transcriptional regulator [Nonomuraea sp. G32]